MSGHVDRGRLWAGGLASAMVLVLLVVVMAWVVRDVLDLGLLPPLVVDGALDDDVQTDIVATFVATLLATLVLDLLMVTTPTPLRLFHWLMALAIVVVTLVPLTRGGVTESSVARAIGGAVVGLAISSLLTGVARRSLRPTTYDPRRAL
jgi:hypothetical protein